MNKWNSTPALHILLYFSLLFLISCSSKTVELNTQKDSSQRVNTKARETLKLALPNDYILAFKNETKEMQLFEYLPKKQTLKNWQDMLTVQKFSNNKNLEIFQTNYDNQLKRSCLNGTLSTVSSSHENGYKTKVLLIACPKIKSSSIGETTLIKLIEGNDKLYVIQKAWRTNSFPKEEFPVPIDSFTEWVKGLKIASLCDNRINNRACR